MRDALEVQRQPGNQRDQRRGDPVDRVQLARHPAGDDVPDVRADQDAKQQVTGEPRETEMAEELSGDQRQDQRQAQGKRGR